MNENKKKAVIYCRVSTKEQAEDGNSLVTQEKLCREFAMKNGYEIAHVFVEEGESAKTADRTELQKMFKFCALRQNAISAVLIYKLDRISRNTDDYSQIRLLLKKYNVEIKSTTEHFEDSPVGRFMENTLANIAQFDNDIRAERSTGGMREAAREGRYVWKAPIGYDNVKIEGKHTIAINPLTAPIVRETFAMVAKSEHPKEIIRQMMTEKGMVSRNGKPFARSYFYTMLKNELYTGWIRKFGELNKGTFEPLISQDLFEQVQRVLKSTGHRYSRYKTDNPDFPLRRFVLHPSGRKLTGSWAKGNGGRYAFYRFNGIRCSIKKEVLEEKFSNFMDRYAYTYSEFESLSRQLKPQLDGQTNDRLKQKQLHEREIKELQSKQTILIEKNIEGVIPNDLLKEQLEIIGEKIYKARKSLSEQPQLTINVKELLELGREFLMRPSSIWKNSELPNKLEVQWFQFPSGITYDGEKFGTNEICFLFKEKKEILSPFSSIVTSRVKKSNLVEATTLIIQELQKLSKVLPSRRF